MAAISVLRFYALDLPERDAGDDGYPAPFAIVGQRRG
jgi:hypothetical protein